MAKPKYRFNAERFVADLGGVDECVKKLGCDRTSVYKWMRRGTLDLKFILAAKGAGIGLIDKYFEQK